MDFYQTSVNACLEKFSSSLDGLSESEAKLRQSKTKDITIKNGKKSNFFVKFLSQLKELMVLILLISAIVSIVIGAIENSTSEIVDGVIILGIVIMNALFGVFQESKTEKAIESLKNMTEAEAVVLRDGKVEKVKNHNLVYGDIVVLSAGSIVPADVRIVESSLFKVNESALTGESVAVEKNANIEYGQSVAIADRKNMAYLGSVVEMGHAKGLVVALGKETEFGKIAESLKETKKELTPLQKNIKSVGQVLTYLILLIATVTFVLEVIATPTQILNAFLTAVAISVAAIPESMPAVITIIMSMGIWELSKKKAIVKKMHAVETLGCCDVICTDKTGTLTENRMIVKDFFCDFSQESKNFERFLDAMTLCNDAKQGKTSFVGDSTEVALVNFALEQGKAKCEKDEVRLAEIPFSAERKMMSTLNLVNGEKICFAKGGLDQILSRCTCIANENGERVLSDNDKRNLLAKSKKMCGKALRVLAFAYKKAEALSEDELIFLGICGMQDPPRREIKSAIKKCRNAGMRPIMITGDHKDTAFAIAKEVGIAESETEVLSGDEIDKISDEEFSAVVERVNVFARVSPAHKARIVQILKKNGHNVAMTGDGVNDAPSMKSATIAIGMGKSGTDVTKEVADIIITDDNFATIIVAVEQGRKIYNNIQKTVKFLFSANMAEILALFFVTILFPGKAFLLPVQILFVNLITDSLPAVALGVEKVESGVMNEKPRSAKSGLFSNGVGLSIFVLGTIQTALTLSAYIFGLYSYGESVAMTMAFYTLNLIQLFYMFTARSKESCFRTNPFKNKFFTLSLAFGLGLLLLMAITPFGSLLSLSSLNFSCWLIVLILSLSIIFIGELYKKIEKKLAKNHEKTQKNRKKLKKWRKMKNKV